MLERLRGDWSGPRWRWWALGAGIALTALCLLAAAALAATIGANVASLALLFLMTALMAAALVGAGLLDRISGRMLMNRGLERQPLPPEQGTLSAASGGRANPAGQERRDRQTIRAGLIVLPLLAAFLGLLFS